MNYMFFGASAFNIDIHSWDISNVKYLQGMFLNASFFNQDIGDWNTSNVTNMSAMFQDADSFNQDISQWDISNVFHLDDIFDAVALSVSHYDHILKQWSSLAVNNTLVFDADSSHYCRAESARQSLIDNHSWTINDAGKDCTLYFTSHYRMWVRDGQSDIGTVSTNESDDSSYAIVGGADADKFDINASSGVLSFKTAPDIDVPRDKNRDNIYRVQIQASAVLSMGAVTDIITIQVEVKDLSAIVPIITYTLF
jgi:surface protein